MNYEAKAAKDHDVLLNYVIGVQPIAFIVADRVPSILLRIAIANLVGTIWFLQHSLMMRQVALNHAWPNNAPVSPAEIRALYGFRTFVPSAAVPALGFQKAVLLPYYLLLLCIRGRGQKSVAAVAAPALHFAEELAELTECLGQLAALGESEHVNCRVLHGYIDYLNGKHPFYQQKKFTPSNGNRAILSQIGNIQHRILAKLRTPPPPAHS